MAKKIGEQIYNTDLAAEFYMMSILHRTGREAYLTLGNKKGVDIVVLRPDGTRLNIEVKGVNVKNDWMVGSSGELPAAPNYFYALVFFNGKIREIDVPTDFWLVPSLKLKQKKMYKVAGNDKTVYIPIRPIIQDWNEYKNQLEILAT